MDAPIYVVVCSTGGALTDELPDGGPIVCETDVTGATLQKARERCGHIERTWKIGGACRVGRVVFEDEEGRPL